MNITSAPDGPDGPVWVEEIDALIRGIAHAMSNRTAALSLAAESVDDPDAELRSESRERLISEVARLGEVTDLLKLLPMEGLGRPEAFQVREVVAEAVALHRHHLGLRAVPLDIVHGESVPPVRIERRVLLRALVLLLSAARRAAQGRDEPVTLSIEGDADQVSIHTTTSVPSVGRELAELAGRMGGSVSGGPTGLRMQIPSLAALRAREATARPGDTAKGGAP